MDRIDTDVVQYENHFVEPWKIKSATSRQWVIYTHSLIGTKNELPEYSFIQVWRATSGANTIARRPFRAISGNRAYGVVKAWHAWIVISKSINNIQKVCQLLDGIKISKCAARRTRYLNQRWHGIYIIYIIYIYIYICVTKQPQLAVVAKDVVRMSNARPPVQKHWSSLSKLNELLKITIGSKMHYKFSSQSISMIIKFDAMCNHFMLQHIKKYLVLVKFKPCCYTLIKL